MKDAVLGGAFFSSEPAIATCSRPAFSGWQRWAVMAAFLLLIVFRLPNAWVHGRFQDEEATVFLAYAWHFPAIEALFRPFGGYLNLGATATTVLVAELVKSGILPLERAPYLTMCVALAFQALPGVLILTGSAQWLESRLAVVAALLIVAIAPATEEVFFNVLHIQFHLALCVALILAMDVPRHRFARLGYGTVLVLAPLCGPGSIVLLPLYILRALLDRDPARGKQAALLAAGAAVQLSLFFGSSPLRGHAIDPAAVAAAMFVRLIALPTMGIGIANLAGQTIIGSDPAGSALLRLSGAVTIIVFALLIAAAAKQRSAALWLLLSALAVASVSLGPGIVTARPADLMNVLRGERYNFLPLVLLGLSLLVLAMRSQGWGRLAFGLPLGLMLVSGTIWYFRPSPDFASGPSWPAEVAIWRNDPKHPLQVWPAPFAADLSYQAHWCTPPGRDLARSNEPRYCESGWLAAFF